MKEKPLISIIIPTYNRPQKVICAIESVLNQTYQNIEIIVISDGPDKLTANKINKVKDEKVYYFQKERNEGVSATRNYGINKANGKWIALLDDDDVWLPNKLEKQFSELQKHSTKNILISGKEKVIYDEFVKIKPDILPKKDENLLDYLFSIQNYKKSRAHTSTLMAPKNVFNKVKFNESLERHEDWQWLIDVYKEFEIELVFVPDIVAIQDKSHDGLSTSGNYYYSKNWYLKNKKQFSLDSRAGFVLSVLNSKAAFNFHCKEFIWLLSELKKNKNLTFHNLFRLIFPWWFRPEAKKYIKKMIGKLNKLKSFKNFINKK